MPQRGDDNTILMLNMIYERQIKRMLNHFIEKNQTFITNTSQNLDFYVMSASDPTVFLDYASISIMNNTLEGISDPN